MVLKTAHYEGIVNAILNRKGSVDPATGSERKRKIIRAANHDNAIAGS
ncbi:MULTISPECIES: hypothetical protein [Citrobacter]|nr:MULTISPECIES: hypothetical protein [Citrobacter]MCL7682402.1 hypothetical protein [Citrobacter youngae]MDM2939161.1 hypothetical protein [Citrobacter sp. Cy082]HEE0081484.1 hypothetical protein [Citrobacter youngae]HEF0076662.1 hypothetical protein [Citrobacter youngae]HEF0089059.1 hypothetical protein [Citrobacter youngae]